ncbi:ubiquitin-related domain-containing protein [Dissophora ornata]|nr:hypothetical protein BGZ58_011121 [Dissophora ornata]KAI8601140.1 ubiquitin-related domain-containing protein [Dissophora ornata]
MTASIDPTKSAEYIELKVHGDEPAPITFKIKRHAQLKKLMVKYCTLQKKDFDSVRFLYDEQRLHPMNTPELLDLKDGDVIDVVIAQYAG